MTEEQDTKKRFFLSTLQGYEGSHIYKVWSPDKSEVWGVVGAVGNFEKAGLLIQNEYDSGTWAFFPVGLKKPIFTLTAYGIIQYIINNYMSEEDES